jgi:hypothetical protein
MSIPARSFIAAGALLTAVAVPASQAAAAPRSSVSLSVAAGPIHNLDDGDPDAGTGPGGRLRLGYRTSFGLEPIATIVPLGGMPAKDTPAAWANGLGLRYGLTLGEFEPYVEASVLFVAGEVTSMTGGGVGYSVAPGWQVGVFVDYISTFVRDVGGEPILLEGVEVVLRL